MVGAKKVAENWGVSVRRINQLCNSGSIMGAIKVGGLWKIPDDVLIVDKKQNRLLPCPVGITSYKEVSKECYYVDKTLLIKDIIDNHNKVTLFTRPRRFGKTLTMDMLKTYFEKSDEDTSIYFSDRDIWKYDDSYKNYQGAFPVIFLSFKGAHQNTWEDMYECLSLSLQGEFKRHMDVLDNDNVSSIDKDFFNRMLNKDVLKVECETSLGRLSHILADAYKTRVIVIIDEYDTPIEQGYCHGYYNEVINFMRNLFSAVLKDNSSLEFGILTGILRIAKESLFSGLNNLVVDTILDKKHATYFGFTKDDVKNMANYYGYSNKLDEIADWYDGYKFGECEIYNPWSVINYFNNDCLPKAFWSRTSSNDMILDIISNGNLDMQDSLASLLQDKPIKAVIDADIIYPEIESNFDTIYSFLLMTGYLKNDSVLDTLGDNPICNLLIPNREIKQVFKKEIVDNISKNLNISIVRNFQLALRSNDQEELQEILRQFLLQSVSSYDGAHENFYHGMMLGLLAIMSDDYLISSNKEAGEGRFDVELLPLNKKYPGIIIEFKTIKNGDEEVLSKLADKAIEQIIDKQYTVNLKRNDVTSIQIYGIAFSNKKVVVKTMTL